MNKESKLSLLAKRRYLLETVPQSTGFLAFKAALMMAGATQQTRKANPSAVRAARAEAKSCLFAILSAEFRKVHPPDVANAAARKEALKVVNQWARLVVNEVENAPGADKRTPSTANPPDTAQQAAPVVPQPETPQPETPQQDALATLLAAKPIGRGRKRNFDIELGWIVLKKTTVRAANIEEAHILARQTQFPPQALGKGFVTRTVGIDDQTVRLVHEDFGRIHMDHITGKFVTRIADYDDDYYGDYDDD